MTSPAGSSLLSPSIAPSTPLTPRAARVLAELCADAATVTLVRVGAPTVIHGRVSFAHGARAAVVAEIPASERTGTGGTVVLTALSRGRAVALSGRVREVGQDSLSLDLFGDLRGSDPRRFERQLEPADVAVSLSWGETTVSAEVRDLCERGLAVMLPVSGPTPADGMSVRVSRGPDRGPFEAKVCHRTLGMDGPDRIRVGLGFVPGTDARVFSGLAPDPSSR
jgi:hypothetical protein